MMPISTLDFDQAVTLVTKTGARFIAIDGLPVSGKSTLADRLEQAIGAQTIYLDDFVRPETEWRGTALPAFPFPYIRYADFLDAVTSLARDGSCVYRPYDWATGHPSANARTIGGGRAVIVEGVSALHPDLAPLYDLRLWVDSDATSTLTASLQRGVGDWEHEWRHLFMPSVERYLQTNPHGRADYLVKGRGL